MKREISIDTESLIAMVVIACGQHDGCFFEYFPKLPSCFTENLNFQGSCGCNADFLRLTVNDRFGVDCWFADEDGDTFFYSLKEIMATHPILYVSIVTHICDMIENLEEE